MFWEEPFYTFSGSAEHIFQHSSLINWKIILPPFQLVNASWFYIIDPALIKIIKSSLQIILAIIPFLSTFFAASNFHYIHPIITQSYPAILLQMDRRSFQIRIRVPLMNKHFSKLRNFDNFKAYIY